MTGIIVTGDHATFLPAVAFLPTAAVDAPPPLTDLPVRPGIFVGRTGALDRLDTPPPAAGGGAVAQVVHGLGGVGKSTVAAHWAATRAAAHNPVWWITADTPA